MSDTYVGHAARFVSWPLGWAEAFLLGVVWLAAVFFTNERESISPRFWVFAFVAALVEVMWLAYKIPLPVWKS